MKPTQLFLQFKKDWRELPPNHHIVSQNLIAASTESRAHCLGTLKIAKQEEPLTRVSLADQMALKRVGDLKVTDQSDMGSSVLGGTVSAEKVRKRLYCGSKAQNLNILEVQQNNAQRDFPNLSAALLRPRIDLLDLHSEQTQSPRAPSEDILDVTPPFECNQSKTSDSSSIKKSTQEHTDRCGSQDLIKMIFQKPKASLEIEELRKNAKTEPVSAWDLMNAARVRLRKEMDPEKLLKLRRQERIRRSRYLQNLRRDPEKVAQEKQKYREYRLRCKETLKNNPEALLEKKKKVKARHLRYLQKLRKDSDRVAKKKRKDREYRLRCKEKAKALQPKDGSF